MVDTRTVMPVNSEALMLEELENLRQLHDLGKLRLICVSAGAHDFREHFFSDSLIGMLLNAARVHLEVEGRLARAEHIIDRMFEAAPVMRTEREFTTATLEGASAQLRIIRELGFANQRARVAPITPDQPERCHPSHETRISDASSFDEICTKCGARDVSGGGWGKLAEPCPMAGKSDQPDTDNTGEIAMDRKAAIREEVEKRHDAIGQRVADRIAGYVGGPGEGEQGADHSDYGFVLAAKELFSEFANGLPHPHARPVQDGLTQRLDALCSPEAEQMPENARLAAFIVQGRLAKDRIEQLMADRAGPTEVQRQILMALATVLRQGARGGPAEAPERLSTEAERCVKELENVVLGTHGADTKALVAEVERLKASKAWATQPDGDGVPHDAECWMRAFDASQAERCRLNVENQSLRAEVAKLKAEVETLKFHHKASMAESQALRSLIDTEATRRATQATTQLRAEIIRLQDRERRLRDEWAAAADRHPPIMKG